jgi:hypothetical protein
MRNVTSNTEAYISISSIIAARPARLWLPRGVIVGSVKIVGCEGEEDEYEIQLARPERLKDFLKPTNQPQPLFWIPQFR